MDLEVPFFQTNPFMSCGDGSDWYPKTLWKIWELMVIKSDLHYYQQGPILLLQQKGQWKNSIDVRKASQKIDFWVSFHIQPLWTFFWINMFELVGF
jgi:hypothetical protein